MKMTEIRGLEDKDLLLQIDKLRKELFDLRCKAATESLDNPGRIQELKRSIARLLTEQRGRAIQKASQS